MKTSSKKVLNKQKQSNDPRSLGIAKRLKDIRKKAGLTQLEWSEIIGMSSPAVGALENAWYLPNIEVLKVIKEKYGYSYDYLLDGVDGENVNELKDEIVRLKKVVDKLLK
jgi:transcriptional regulator with XRE-family HTH domain